MNMSEFQDLTRDTLREYGETENNNKAGALLDLPYDELIDFLATVASTEVAEWLTEDRDVDEVLNNLSGNIVDGRVRTLKAGEGGDLGDLGRRILNQTMVGLLVGRRIGLAQAASKPTVEGSVI